MFLNQSLNDKRIYGVQLYNLGVPTTIVVDDYIPAYYGTTAAFAKPTNDNGLWPIILEKAFSKFNGSYHASEAGYPNTAIEKMTNSPGKY